jgi:hypothetical protein
MVLVRTLGVFCALGLTTPTLAETVSLSTGDCKKLVQHVPSDDVTYKPGVDVRGKAVVPADIDGGYQMNIPEAIDIQIGVDLADRMGLRAARRQGAQPGAPVRKVLPYEGKAAIGTLTIKGNDAFWNGERLVPQDEKLLAEACRQGLTAAGVILPTRKPEPPKE